MKSLGWAGAGGGGGSNANDEWIELKNISGNSIDISGYQLLDRGEQIKIVFDKNTVIPAGGFFLLERNGDEAVSSVKADLIYSGALSNTDEGLRLFDGGCNLIDEVLANSKWPAGDNAAKKTMERNNSDLTWHTSAAIGGTPKKENSQPVVVKKQESLIDISEETEEQGEEITPRQEEQIKQQEQIQQATSSPPQAVSFKQCSFATSQSPSRQKIIINEVAWMGTANSANDEWIELKNISGAELNLSGHQLIDQGEQIKITFENGDKIPTGGFYLLERTDDNSVPNISADKIYTGGLSNTNEGLRLFDGQCNLIDEVLANPSWPAGDNVSKQTMERKNDLSWQTSANAGGTPKAVNSSGYIIIYGGGGGGVNNPPAGNLNQSTVAIQYSKILINEIQISPIENRFIELYNPNDQAVSLSGWYLQRKTQTGSDFNSFVSKNNFEGKIIEAKSYFVIFRATSTYSDVVVSGMALTEDNTLQLKNPNQEVADKVGWGSVVDFEGSGSAVNPNENQSIQRKFQNNTFIDTNNNSQDFEIQTCPSPKAQPKNCSATNQAPSAFFVYTPTNPVVGDLITFNAASSSDPDSDGTISLYQWDFGDNATSTISIATTTHNYSQAGDYQVSLIVFDNQNASSTATSTISVSSIEQPNQAPDASFSYSPQNPKVGDVITFNAASSTDDGQIISYQWDFGDNATSSATTTTTIHTYFQAGDYQVGLVVFDDQNTSSTATSTIISVGQLGEANHIVISEILFNPQGLDEGKEFIELYNPTNSEIDINDWSLRILKNGATSTDSLAKFGSKPEDITLIKRKSFLLVGFNSYISTSTPADIIRSATLPNSTSTIYLIDNQGSGIDQINYSNILENVGISEGQSLERKAFYNNQCISSQNDGEFLGNGCDTDDAIDFEIRSIPNPQNSLSFPEPRSAPAAPADFVVRYSSSTMKLIFNWQASQDYSGATSSLTYKITDISNTSSTLEVINTASTTAEISINEVGRDYQFSIQTFDKERLGSAISTASIAVPVGQLNHDNLIWANSQWSNAITQFINKGNSQTINRVCLWLQQRVDPKWGAFATGFELYSQPTDPQNGANMTGYTQITGWWGIPPEIAGEVCILLDNSITLDPGLYYFIHYAGTRYGDDNFRIYGAGSNSYENSSYDACYYIGAPAFSWQCVGDIYFHFGIAP
ncbi:MAG: lamin tail domain-containing protein [bacterium]|nr:lamin tail domain-containing protein [bacterium]